MHNLTFLTLDDQHYEISILEMALLFGWPQGHVQLNSIIKMWYDYLSKFLQVCDRLSTRFQRRVAEYLIPG